jgi:peptide/nickel transport system permease protein
MSTRPSSWWREPQLAIGITVLTVVAVAAVVGPFIVGPGSSQDLDRILEGPSWSHLLGTDQLGRDVFARVLMAIRIDLVIGLGALVVPFALGTLIGATAAWRGGWFDRVVSVLADVVQAFPYYLLIIVLVFFLGAGVESIFVAVALVAWVSYMRIVRAGVESAVRQNYVVAALGGGLTNRRVFFRHVMPNVIGEPISFVTTDIVVIIISTATLSYLGLGIAPPTPELGAMIADGQQYISTRPLGSIAPGLTVGIIGAALALIGAGVNRRLKGNQ